MNFPSRIVKWFPYKMSHSNWFGLVSFNSCEPGQKTDFSVRILLRIEKNSSFFWGFLMSFTFIFIFLHLKFSAIPIRFRCINEIFLSWFRKLYFIVDCIRSSVSENRFQNRHFFVLLIGIQKCPLFFKKYNYSGIHVPIFPQTKRKKFIFFCSECQ